MANGQTHLHTECSLNDGTIQAEALRKRAEELGCSAIVITDHGNLMAVQEFKKTFKGSPVKLIPGCELYTHFDDLSLTREHLIVFARDYTGYQAIMKAVSATYDSPDDKGFPIADAALLETYFGEGAPGHGHVFATTACMNGILCSVVLRNRFLKKEIEKIEDKISRLGFDFDSYHRLEQEIATESAKLEALAAKRADYALLKGKTTKSLEKQLRKADDPDEYEKITNQINDLEKRITEAKEQYPLIKAEESALSKALTAKKTEYKKLGTKTEKLAEYDREIDALKAKKNDKSEAALQTVNRILKMVSIFGKDNMAIELQYHGIKDEGYAMRFISEAARSMKIPVIAANDCHILNNTEDEQLRRQILRSLRFNKWEEQQEGDSELYLKTDEELAAKLAEVIPADMVKQAIDFKEQIISECLVEFPDESHYPKWSGDETAEERLWRLSNEGIAMRYPMASDWTDVHEKRLQYEFDVMKEMDVCDYMVIVQDFLEYGRLLGKIDLNEPEYLADPFNIDVLRNLAKGRVGLGIGVGRGSCVGSLISYLIGITNVDPIANNLLFERFLNRERVSMPDIDSDFSPEIRGKVLDYVKHKYGQNAVCGIMTKGTQAAKNAIRNCARLYGDKTCGDSGAFYSLGSEMCAMIPREDLKATIAAYEDDITAKYGTNPDAMEILHNAALVENTFTTVGMHAAGVIIADNGDVSDFIPLMNSADGQKITQCDKDACEALGALKMDFLGLKNLQIITETLRAVQKNYGKSLDMSHIPLDDANVYREIFCKGRTNSVFQFESQGMKSLLRRYKPTTMNDLTLLNAIFRPGPIQYLDEVCNIRDGQEAPRTICAKADALFEETYGVPIFQEQIMLLFHDVAGFSMGDADNIRRAMSKKKKAVFESYKPQFISGMAASGMTEEDAVLFWDELCDFSAYAFNRSHAAAYAVTAYYTAYLKYHYPAEYLAAVLNHTEFDKIDSVIFDAKSFGVHILPPNVNLSKQYFSAEEQKNAIRYGLCGIKQVSADGDVIDTDRRANGAYMSFASFVERTNVSKDVLTNLVLAGCFDDLDGTVKPQRNYCFTMRNKLLAEMSAKVTLSDIADMFAKEREVAGAFLSGNPAAGYDTKFQIAKAYNSAGNAEIIGFTTAITAKRTKSGSAMAVFRIEDVSSSVDAVMFPTAYEAYGDLLAAGKVLQFSGKMQQKNEGDDTVTQYVVDKISIPSQTVQRILIVSPTGRYRPFNDTVKDYINPDGLGLYIQSEFGEIIPLSVKVDLSILDDYRIAKYIIPIM